MSQKRPMTFNSRIEKYFIWPWAYIVVIFLMAVVGGAFDFRLGVAFAIVFILVAVVGYVMNRSTHKHLMSEVLNFALSFSKVQRGYMNQFEVANVILDPEGRIRWFNDAFDKMLQDVEAEFDGRKLLERNINAILPAVNHELFPSEIEGFYEQILTLGERHYRLVIRHMRIEVDDRSPITNEVVAQDDLFSEPVIEEQVLYTAYFFDDTTTQNLKKKNKEQRAVTALIYIDNYEEVLKSIEDVRRPMLVALIDRNLEKFAKSIDGVFKKYEKDKYLLIFQRKYLDELEAGKFAILDEIRDIDIGNEMPVTLSIGVGLHDYAYIQSIEFARMAIDLALGRGGDQTVVKNNDKFAYYGGKNKSVENSTRVKARVKAYAFKELIEGCDRVVIMGHKRQDLDSLGAAVGVYACAKMLETPANIVINDVTSAVKPLYDQIVESGQYPQDVFITGQEAVSYMTDKTLLVIVDVNRPSYTEHGELLQYVKNVIVFDHHRVSADFIENPVLSYVEPYASSTSEMVSEIIRYISEKVKLEPIEADALLSGITVDTKNFAINTGVKTFEAAAFLKRNGADVVRVKRFFKNDMASYKAKATAVRDCHIYKDNIAISVCPSDVENPTLVAAQAADELLNIAGIKASFVLTQIGETIYISARSMDAINVQLVMEAMGGGGHLAVAGAQVIDSTIEEVLASLKDVLDKYLEEGDEI